MAQSLTWKHRTFAAGALLATTLIVGPQTASLAMPAPGGGAVPTRTVPQGGTTYPKTTPNPRFPVNEAGTKCTKSETAAIRSVQAYLLRTFPGSVNNGTFVCRKIAGSNTVSLHGVGRAADIKARNRTQRFAIMTCLVRNYKVLGIQRVIDEGASPRMIWNPTRGTWKANHAFKVPNNLHYEVNLRSARNGTVPTSRPGFNAAACRS